MLEILVFSLFMIALILCIISGKSLLIALAVGYFLFAGYALKKGNSLQRVLVVSLEGIQTTKGILTTFILIGIMTAFWRGAGTIATIVAYVTHLIVPSVLILAIFWLNSLVSFLTGTSFGTAATMGVISITLANVVGCSPILSGGAMLSGAFFGDRCSPVSTSAALCAELSKTDIYKNIKGMLRTGAVPFICSSVVFLVLGHSGQNTAELPNMANVFQKEFIITPVALIPAILILVLALFRVKVKKLMFLSILTAAAICVGIQQMSINELLHSAVFGYHATDTSVAAMMNGGGLISMVRVSAIVCLSSTYAGIFKKTGMLDGIQNLLNQFSKGKPVAITVTLTSILTSMLACNQTLAIMLTHQICDKLVEDKERFVLSLENTVVVIAALVPWSIAGTVALSSAGAPIESLLASCYLYFLPIWWCIRESIFKGDKIFLDISQKVNRK